MSAIPITCAGCGAQYMAGMVGSTPWPAHECPSPTLRSLANDPRATIKLSDEQRRDILAQARAENPRLRSVVAKALADLRRLAR